MLSPSIRNREKKVTIHLNELRQLVFWAAIGVKKVKGGQYIPEVLTTIEEMKKQYNCQTSD